MSTRKEIKKMESKLEKFDFNKISTRTNFDFLFDFAENDDMGSKVAYALADNYAKLPNIIRNDLLVKLAENEYAADGLTCAIAKNYANLPSKVQNLLFKIAESKYNDEDIVREVANYFDKLPPKIHELFFSAVKNADIADVTAFAILYNLDKIPQKTAMDILLKLIENPKPAQEVALSIAGISHDTPVEFQNLFFKIATTEETKKSVIFPIIFAYDVLSEKERDLIFPLAENPDMVDGVDKIFSRYSARITDDKFREKLRATIKKTKGNLKND